MFDMNLTMRICVRLALALTLALGAGTACAGGDGYVFRDGKACRVDGGKVRVLKDAPSGSVSTEAGLWSWIVVDPAGSGEMKGSAGGIYFFSGRDANPAGFLPVEEEAESCRLYFSPSGKMLLVAWGMEYIQHLSLYAIDGRNFAKKASFEVSGPAFWIDAGRFAFTLVDPARGPRAEGRYDMWWSSAAVYDVAKAKLAFVRKATPVACYAVTGADAESGTLKLWETSVQRVQDWKDEDGVSEREIAVRF